MKLIIAVIQPPRLEAVKEALAKVDISRLTISDVQGCGRQKGHSEIYRGHEYTVNLLHKVKLEIAVNDEAAQSTIEAVIGAARSGSDGKVGDGKIFVIPLESCIRIRTGETDAEAI
ncbi:MAG: P-II family nitrogen regulator [Planctomycetota bacterium]